MKFELQKFVDWFKALPSDDPRKLIFQKDYEWSIMDINGVDCNIKEPTFLPENFKQEYESIEAYQLKLIYRLMYDYYNDRPEFDQGLLDEALSDCGAKKNSKTLADLTKCMKYNDYMQYIKYKVEPTSNDNLNTYHRIQLAVMTSEDFDKPVLGDLVKEPYAFPLITDEARAEAIEQNPSETLYTFLDRAKDKNELFTHKLELEALFKVDGKIRIDVLEKLYRYNLDDFIDTIVPIDLRFIKLFYYMAIDRYGDGWQNRRLSAYLNGLIDRRKGDRPITDEERAMKDDNWHKSTWPEELKDFRYTKKLRQLFCIMRTCALKRVSNNQKGLLGKALFFIKVHDFDFYKVYDAMYNKCNESIF